MEINGTIYKILQQEELTFADGTKKKKGGFVIMREGEYPKPVAFELFGEDRLSLLNGLTLGMPVRVSFFAESREGKDGRYYTTLRCTNVLALTTQPRHLAEVAYPEPSTVIKVFQPEDEVPF